MRASHLSFCLYFKYSSDGIKHSLPIFKTVLSLSKLMSNAKLC